MISENGRKNNSKHLSIIVPYRNRAAHLEEFVPAIRAYLPHASLIIVEQTDKKPFNRARLLNIGFLYSYADYFAFHDVDKIPLNANYSYPERPRQIARNPFQTQSFFGGVTLFNRADFEMCKGYSNNFWGWGGEDNEMMFQVIRKGVKAEWDYGIFKDLPHARPAREFEAARWRQAQQPRQIVDGFPHTKYTLVEDNVVDYVRYIKVDLSQ